MGVIKISKLFEELTEAGIPIVGVSSDGRIDFVDAVTPTQRSLAQQILAAHDPTAKTKQEQVSEATLSELRTLNDKEVQKLTTADWQKLLMFFLAERGWLNIDGKLRMPASVE